VYDWLSYYIVRFKIEVGVEEKFTCKYVTKQTQHGDWAVAADLWPAVIFAAAQHTTHMMHTPSFRIGSTRFEWRQHARAVQSQ